MKIIAVDFDGTLCEEKWPDIGAPRQHVINELIRRQEDGTKLILWTCREGDLLRAAVMWCLNHGLIFDAVNDNLEENKAYFGNNSRKIYATEYWDDKSVLIVNAGEVTRFVQRNNLCDGDVTITSRMRTSVEVADPPYWPRENAVIPSPYQSVRGRLKAWWKKWHCE